MNSLFTARALFALVAICLAVIILPFFAYAVRRIYAPARRNSFWFVLLQIAAMLTMTLAIYKQISGAPNNLNNDHRLAPSAALIHGYPVYNPPDQGPALSTIYGPATVWTYLPAAAFFKRPSNAVRFGVAINMLMYYAPAIFLLAVTSRISGSGNWALCALAVFALTTFNESLDTVSGLLHADAPAIGWGAVACALGLWYATSRNPWQIVGAGLASAFSVLAKQVMLPVIPVLCVYLLIVCGWRTFLFYAIAAAGFTLALLEFAALSMGGWQALRYNVFFIPTHQPFRREELLPAISLLANLSAAYVIVTIAAASIHAFSARTSSIKELLLSNPSVLLLATGLALSTTSILGKIKVVGSINTLSPSIYFFLLAAVVELQRIGIPAIKFEDPQTIRRAVCGAILLIFCVVQLPIVLYSFVLPSQRDAMDTVYSFSKEYPGEVYFPQFPLSVLLAENHLYHFAWGLSDRAEAGRPLNDQYFHQYIPNNAKVAAVMDWVWNDEMFHYLGKEVDSPIHSMLPGFKFYEIRRERLAAQVENRN